MYTFEPPIRWLQSVLVRFTSVTTTDVNLIGYVYILLVSRFVETDTSESAGVVSNY